MKKNKLFGFTLAEVLITLTIIGIIAAMTIPNLMVKYNERVTVTKVKKIYSLMSQSYQYAVSQYGTPDEWDLEVSTFEEDEDGNPTNLKNPGTKKFLKLFLSGTKIEEIKEEELEHESFFLNSKHADPKEVFYKLPDGTLFTGWIHLYDCQKYLEGGNMLKDICGDVKVDINGRKKPNIVGKDQFVFWVTKTHVLPVGRFDDPERPPETFCNPHLNHYHNGFGCTAWVIMKGEMPWLHGKIPSWDD